MMTPLCPGRVAAAAVVVMVEITRTHTHTHTNTCIHTHTLVCLISYVLPTIKQRVEITNQEIGLALGYFKSKEDGLGSKYSLIFHTVTIIQIKQIVKIDTRLAQLNIKEQQR